VRSDHFLHYSRCRVGEAEGDDDTGIGENLHSAPPARTIALGVNINFKKIKK
jgi:hypothetical protein